MLATNKILTICNLRELKSKLMEIHKELDIGLRFWKILWLSLGTKGQMSMLTIKKSGARIMDQYAPNYLDS